MSALWSRLKALLLRGPLLAWWVRRCSGLLAADYSRFLAARADQSGKDEAPSPARGSGRACGSILFLCCNMWERRELLPELRKLADVTFLDLSACYRAGDRIKSAFQPAAFAQAVAGVPADRRFDCAVVYLDAQRLDEEILAWVRARTDGPVFGLNLDDKTTYGEYDVFRQEAQNYRRWAGSFDANLTNSRAFVDIYRLDGHACLYLPTGYHYDPERHFPPSEPVFQRQLAFVGSCKPEREEFIAQLRSLGVEVEVFGGGWAGGRFMDDGPEIYRTTQINLGIGYNLPGDHFTNLKNRDFECPGAGGCYLTTFDWELADLFQVGREILCYRTFADLCEILLHYGRRPGACLEIARAGFERARREHTWAHRFADVFLQAGLTVRSPS